MAARIAAIGAYGPTRGRDCITRSLVSAEPEGKGRQCGSKHRNAKNSQYAFLCSARSPENIASGAVRRVLDISSMDVLFSPAHRLAAGSH